MDIPTRSNNIIETGELIMNDSPSRELYETEIIDSKRRLNEINLEIKARKLFLETIQKNDVFRKLNKIEQVKILSEEIVLKNTQIADLTQRLTKAKAKLKEMKNSKSPLEVEIKKRIQSKLAETNELQMSQDKKYQIMLANSNKQFQQMQEKLEFYQKDIERFQYENSEIKEKLQANEIKYQEKCENIKQMNENFEDFIRKIDILEKEKSDEGIAREKAEQCVFQQKVRIEELENIEKYYNEIKNEVENASSMSKYIDNKILYYREYKIKFLQLCKALKKFCEKTSSSFQRSIEKFNSKEKLVVSEVKEASIKIEEKLNFIIKEKKIVDSIKKEIEASVPKELPLDSKEKIKEISFESNQMKICGFQNILFNDVKLIDTKANVIESIQIIDLKEKTINNKPLNDNQNAVSLSQFVQENIDNKIIPSESKTALINSIEIEPDNSLLTKIVNKDEEQINKNEKEKEKDKKKEKKKTNGEPSEDSGSEKQKNMKKKAKKKKSSKKDETEDEKLKKNKKKKKDKKQLDNKPNEDSDYEKHKKKTKKEKEKEQSEDKSDSDNEKQKKKNKGKEKSEDKLNIDSDNENDKQKIKGKDKSEKRINEDSDMEKDKKKKKKEKKENKTNEKFKEDSKKEMQKRKNDKSDNKEEGSDNEKDKKKEKKANEKGKEKSENTPKEDRDNEKENNKKKKEKEKEKKNSDNNPKEDSDKEKEEKKKKKKGKDKDKDKDKEEEKERNEKSDNNSSEDSDKKKDKKNKKETNNDKDKEKEKEKEKKKKKKKLDNKSDEDTDNKKQKKKKKEKEKEDNKSNEDSDNEKDKKKKRERSDKNLDQESDNEKSKKKNDKRKAKNHDKEDNNEITSKKHDGSIKGEKEEEKEKETRNKSREKKEDNIKPINSKTKKNDIQNSKLNSKINSDHSSDEENISKEKNKNKNKKDKEKSRRKSSDKEINSKAKKNDQMDSNKNKASKLDEHDKDDKIDSLTKQKSQKNMNKSKSNINSSEKRQTLGESTEKVKEVKSLKKKEKSDTSKSESENISEFDINSISKKTVKETKEKIKKMNLKVKEALKKLNLKYYEIIESLKEFNSNAGVSLKEFDKEFEGIDINLNVEIEDRERTILKVNNLNNELKLKQIDNQKVMKNLETKSQLLSTRINDLSEKTIILRSQLAKEISDNSSNLKIKDKLLSDAKAKLSELENKYNDIKLQNSKNHKKSFISEGANLSKNSLVFSEKFSNYDKLLKEYRLKLDKMTQEKQMSEKNFLRKDEKHKKVLNRLSALEEELLKKDNTLIQTESKLKKSLVLIETLKSELAKSGSTRSYDPEYKRQLEYKDAEIATLKDILSNFRNINDRDNLRKSKRNIGPNVDDLKKFYVRKNPKIKERLSPLDTGSIQSDILKKDIKKNEIYHELNYNISDNLLYNNSKQFSMEPTSKDNNDIQKIYKDEDEVFEHNLLLNKSKEEKKYLNDKLPIEIEQDQAKKNEKDEVDQLLAGKISPIANNTRNQGESDNKGSEDNKEKSRNAQGFNNSINNSQEINKSLRNISDGKNNKDITIKNSEKMNLNDNGKVPFEESLNSSEKSKNFNIEKYSDQIKSKTEDADKNELIKHEKLDIPIVSTDKKNTFQEEKMDIANDKELSKKMINDIIIENKLSSKKLKQNNPDLQNFSKNLDAEVKIGDPYENEGHDVKKSDQLNFDNSMMSEEDLSKKIEENDNINKQINGEVQPNLNINENDLHIEKNLNVNQPIKDNLNNQSELAKINKFNSSNSNLKKVIVPKNTNKKSEVKESKNISKKIAIGNVKNIKKPK